MENLNLQNFINDLCKQVESRENNSRKNADYQWSELVPFLILKNKIRSKQDVTVSLVNSYDIDIRYYYDLLDASEKEVNNYINNFYFIYLVFLPTYSK